MSLKSKPYPKLGQYGFVPCGEIKVSLQGVFGPVTGGVTGTIRFTEDNIVIDIVDKQGLANLVPNKIIFDQVAQALKIGTKYDSESSQPVDKKNHV
jgi:hypothetical protein